MGVCNFLGSVSSQQKFEATDVKALGQTMLQLLDRSMLQISEKSMLQLHVTAQFYLENKRKIHPWGVRACRPKRREEKNAPACRVREKERERGERERERESALWLLFLCFSLLLGLPNANWANQECCCFTWGPQTFLCSTFAGFSLPCLLATAILDSFPLFYLPNKTMAQDGCPTSIIRLAFQSTERRECWGKGCMPTVPRRCDIIF